eukprot:gene3959-4952_t
MTSDNNSNNNTNRKPFRNLDIPIDEYTPKGYELKFVQILTRHGRRTPGIDKYPFHLWTCNSPEHLITNKDKETSLCEVGQLTVSGVHDMIDLGKAYSSLFIDHLKFLDPTYNPSQIFIRSTNIPRTIASARSFMHGLYGGSFSDVEEKSPNQSSFFMMSLREENMYPHGCDRVKFLYPQLKNHPKVKQENKDSNLAEFTKKVQSLLNQHHAEEPDSPFKITTFRSYMGLVNTFDCFNNHGLPVPKQFTQDVIDRMYLESAKEYKSMALFPMIPVLGMGKFIDDLTRQMKLKAASTSNNNSDNPAKDLKLSLYSGHDTTLGGILVAYDMYEDNKHPITSSSLEFCLFEKTKQDNKNQEKEKDNQFVKVIYNQKVIHINSCRNDEVDNMCPLSRFLEISNKLIPTDFKEQCKITQQEKDDFLKALAENRV